MKVIYLIDSLEGYGAEKSIVEIALQMNLVEPLFIHLNKGDKLKTELLNAGIKVYSLNLTPASKVTEAVELIVPIIKEEKPVILHSMLFKSDMVARKLKQIFPDLILIGSFVSNSYGKRRYSNMSLLSKFKLFTTQCKDRFTISNVDFFISNSKAIKISNEKALGISPAKVQVIYRGRNFKKIILTSEEFDTTGKNPNFRGKNVFLNVGRLMLPKGQLDLVRAFKKLVEVDNSNILLLAGEGPLRIELENYIAKNSLKKNVFLLGYREDIPELLALSDFFVFSSYYEGLPGALVEAVIAKKPCIVSRIPENEECFPKGGAIFYPPGDIDFFYNKLKEAIVDPEWKNRIEASFAYAEQNFKIQRVSSEYEAFYNRVLEKEYYLN